MTSDDRSFAGGIASPAGSGALVFTYDGLGRVSNTTLAGSAQASYTYDRSSNRTSKTENGSTFLFTFDATDVLATQQKGTGAVEAFLYDAAGNLTKEWTAGATYRTTTWDAANRLTTIAPASGSAAVLTYDPLGRIATRQVGTAATTTYGYAGLSDVVVRAAGASTTTYLATPGGARMGTSTGGTAHWLLYDLLGSVVASEPAGSGTTSIVDALRYDAYGQTLGLAPAGGSTLGLRFRGLIDLAPTADPDVAGAGSDPLYQMGARAYAPHLGTFTKLDTYAGRAQDPISLNRYLYAHANPTSLIDPSGHAVQKGPCGPDGMACDQAGYNPTDTPQYQHPKARTIEPRASGGTSSTGGQSAGGSVPPPVDPPLPPGCIGCLVDDRGVIYDPFGEDPLYGHQFPYLCAGAPDVQACLAAYYALDYEIAEKVLCDPDTCQPELLGYFSKQLGERAVVNQTTGATLLAWAASTDPTKQCCQGDLAIKARWHAQIGKAQLRMGRALGVFGTLMTVSSVYDREIEAGERLGRSGPEIALRIFIRSGVNLAGSWGGSTAGAAAGGMAGPAGGFVGYMAGGIAVGEIFDDLFIDRFGE